MKEYLLSCDWGTSAFRLRLVDSQKQKIISEIISDAGIAATYAAWKAAIPLIADRQLFFINKLKEQIINLEKKAEINLENIDIVISGMASSSIGLVELPYSDAPFKLDGSQATIYSIEATNYFPHKIRLISGVKTNNDVMRGEETQLIGLMELLKLSQHQPCVLILTGTHSKHLFLENNYLILFKTFMTGELFNVLSNHSILKDSIELSKWENISSNELIAFNKGINDARSIGLLENLFKVRTNQLFQKLNKKENSFYLSGLLIGSELKTLSESTNYPIILCSGNNLFYFYKQAIDCLNLSERTIIVSAESVDKSVVIGQMKIIQKLKN